MSGQLPVIDFAPLLDPDSSDDKKRAAALELDKACREVGFFYLKNHGICEDLRQEMLAVAREFFEGATTEDKQKIKLRTKAEGGDNARGYLQVRSEKKGSHEAIDWYRPVDTQGPPYTTGQGVNQWPEKPPNLRPTAERYSQALESLGHAVIKAMAMGLSVDESMFMDRVDKAFWNLRILGYEGRKSKSTALAGIGEHTDFGILTFLLTDSKKQSLQVLSSKYIRTDYSCFPRMTVTTTDHCLGAETGEWIWADPIEGCFICNIGDMLAEWTRGAYKSTLHRVVHTSDSLRISVPFFFDPNWDAFISPVLPAKEGVSDDKYQGIHYSEKFIRSVEKPLWRDPLKA